METMATKNSLRELLITPVERTLVEVDLPELGEGVTVYVQSLTAREFAAFQRRLFGKNMAGGIEPDRMQKAQLYLLCQSLVDADRNLVLNESDARLLESQDAGLIKKLCDIASKVSNLDSSVEEEAGN